MTEICLLASITGRVQGVGFRYHTRNEALRLGIHGWVENCPDGSVAACLYGSPEKIDSMQAWLRHGPAGAKVEHASFHSIKLPHNLHGFVIR